MSTSELPNTASTVGGRWKLTAIISLIIGIPASLFAAAELIDRLTRSSGPRFAVTASTFPFVIPSDNVLENIGAKNIDSLSKLRAVKGVLFLTIKNVGDLDAEDVIIDVNDSGFADISFDDKRGDHLEFFSKRFKLGVLHSNQTVNVIVWGEEDSFFDSGSPRILFRHGQVPIKLKSPLESNFRVYAFAILVMAAFWILQNYYNLRWYRNIFETHMRNASNIKELEEMVSDLKNTADRLENEIAFSSHHKKSKSDVADDTQ